MAETKVGRRHSKKDEELIQRIKDGAGNIASAADELGADEVAQAAEDVQAAADEAGKARKAISLSEQVDEVTESVMEALGQSPMTAMMGMGMLGGDAPCVCAVYPDYAIITVGDQAYQVPYTLEGDEAVIAPFDAWTRVEQSWVPQKSAAKPDEAAPKAAATFGRAVTVKAVTPDTLTVAGYGVVFDGVDLVGDTFTKSTNFWLKSMPGPRPVLYEHGFDDAIDLAVLGSTLKMEQDDNGLWVEAELNRHTRYMKEVEKLIEAGALGWSSGSAGHLVRREGEADKALITSWPILEFSLTPTPAEPRTLGVQAVRSLAAALPAVKAIIGDNLPDGGVNNMEEQVDEQKNSSMTAPVQVDVAAIVREAAEAAAEKAVRAYQESEPAIKTPGVVAPRIQVSAQQPADDAFKVWLRLGENAPSAVKTALVEGTGANGGYLVPTLYSSEIVVPLANQSYLRKSGARVMTVQGSTAFYMPALTYSAAAALVAEGNSMSESDPTFAQVTYNPYKYYKLSQVSEEIVNDALFDVWGQILQPDYVQAFAEAENTAFTTGTGTSQPQGVVTGATTGITAASKTDFTQDELVSLYFKLDYKYRDNAVWMMNDAVLAYIRKMKDAEGRYLWQPGLDGVTSGTLMGKPIITNNSMSSAFTTGQKLVLFCNPSYYYIADWQGFVIQRLVELYAGNGQIGFRATKRFDGRVMLAAAFQLLILG